MNEFKIHPFKAIYFLFLYYFFKIIFLKINSMEWSYKIHQTTPAALIDCSYMSPQDILVLKVYAIIFCLHFNVTD